MRNEIESRPSVVLLIGLVIGLAAITCPAVILILLASVYFIRSLSVRLCLAGAFVVGLLLAPSPPKPILDSVAIHAKGTVSSVPRLYSDRQSCLVQVNGRKLEVTFAPSIHVSLGDVIDINGIAKSIPEGQEGYAAIYGIEGRLSQDRVVVIEKGAWIAAVAGAWKGTFISFFDKILPQEKASMVEAVCFGSGSLLDSTSKQQMKRGGLIHIVTASGLQVFVLGFLICACLRPLPLSRPAQLAILVAALLLYSFASGLNPAIIRASFMTLLSLFAYTVQREPDALSALAVAGLVCLLWNPIAVFSAGFQFSFVTVACLTLFFHRSFSSIGTPKVKLIRGANEFARFSAVLFLASMPLSAYYFGMVSVIGLISNLAVSWCLPLFVGFSFFAYGLGLFFPGLGIQVAGIAVEPLASWILNVSNWTGGDLGSVSFAPFSGYWLVAFYGAWAMTYRRQVVQP